MLWLSGTDAGGDTGVVADAIAAVWRSQGHRLVHWPLTGGRLYTPTAFDEQRPPLSPTARPPGRLALLGALRRTLSAFDAVMVEQDLDTEFRVLEVLGTTRRTPRRWLLARWPLGSYLAGRGEHVSRRPRRQAEVLYPHFHAIFTLVTGTADDLQAQFGVPQRRLITLPWPLPAWATPTGAAEPLPRVVTWGEATGLKGIEVLVQGLAALGQEGIPASLVMVGGGPRSQEVTRVAEALRVPVTILPPSGATFREVARGGVLHAPQWLDGTGVDLVLGAAAGLPLTAVAAPEAAAELLAQGSLGRLVGLGSLLSLTATLAPLLTDATAWSGYHRAAGIVAAQHTVDQVAGHWARGLAYASDET